MVQVSKSLIVAAALAPAFAAPTTVDSSSLEARSRFGLRTKLRHAGQFGGRVISNKLGLPQIRQPVVRDLSEDTDIEARDLHRHILNNAILGKGRIGISVPNPGMRGLRFGLGGRRPMQNKLFGPGLPLLPHGRQQQQALPQEQQQQQPLQSRETKTKSHEDLDNELEYEDFGLEDLNIREPFHLRLPKFLRKIEGKVAGAALGGAASAPSSPLEQRDFEDIDSREPFHLRLPKFLRKIEGTVAGAAGLGGSASAPSSPLQQRDFEYLDLETREPFHLRLPGFLRKIEGKVAGAALGGAASAPASPLQQRDFEYLDLATREPFHFKLPGFLRKLKSKVFGGGRSAAPASAPATPLEQRDFEYLDIDSREPFHLRLPKFLRKIEHKVLGGGAAPAELQQREEEDFYTREYEDAEFEAREPEFEIDMREMAEFDELD